MAEEGKPEKNYNPSNKWEYYDVSGDKIERKRRSCPKCGAGVFLAEHKDRVACGKCGYTEFAKGGVREPKPVQEDAKEEPPKEEAGDDTPKETPAEEKPSEKEGK